LPVVTHRKGKETAKIKDAGIFSILVTNLREALFLEIKKAANIDIKS
jgi:hypothetical protein